jgi:hypothetical protein
MRRATRAKEMAELRRRSEIVRWKEAEVESLGAFQPWSNVALLNDLGSEAAADNTLEDAAPELHAPSRAGQPPDRRNLRTVGCPRRLTIRIRVPSFLRRARGAPPKQQLLEHDALHPSDPERDTELHSHRSLAFVLVAVAVILLSASWRSIGDYALPYVQNGSHRSKDAARDTARNAKPRENQASSVPVVVAKGDNRRLSRKAGPSAAAKPAQTERRIAHSVASASPFPRPLPSAMSAPVRDVPEAYSRKTLPPATRTSHPAGLSAHSVNAPGAEEMTRAAQAPNPQVRVAWLWIAVGEGNPQAPVELATMYELGSGVVRSCEQARLLLHAATIKGNEQARNNLVQILRGGCSER